MSITYTVSLVLIMTNSIIKILSFANNCSILASIWGRACKIYAIDLPVYIYSTLPNAIITYLQDKECPQPTQWLQPKSNQPSFSTI